MIIMNIVIKAFQLLNQPYRFEYNSKNIQKIHYLGQKANLNNGNH